MSYFVADKMTAEQLQVAFRWLEAGVKQESSEEGYSRALAPHLGSEGEEPDAAEAAIGRHAYALWSLGATARQDLSGVKRRPTSRQNRRTA